MALALAAPPVGAVEVIPRRLYWTDQTKGVVPADTATHHYFSTDQEFTYHPFCQDFGPLDLGALHRYCTMVEEKLRSTELEGKLVVHVVSPEPSKRANSACLICLYQVAVRMATANQAFAPFASVYPPFRPFRDASRGPSTFDVTILDCLEGVRKAIELGWFSWRTFDVAEYEQLARVDGCDANWIVPDKFLAFTGPSPVSPDATGAQVFTPEDCADVFKQLGIGHVVRLNTQEYHRQRFLDKGIRHTDLYFLDGSCPPPEIVSRFLKVTEAEPGPIAVHCKAGLGRTATLIGLYALKHYGFPARAFIGWSRICRPGSVLGPQQQFLLDVEADMRLLREQRARDELAAKFEHVPRPLAAPAHKAVARLAPSTAPAPGRCQRGLQHSMSAWMVPQPIHKAYAIGDFGQGEHLVGAKRRGYSASAFERRHQEAQPTENPADRAAAAVAGAVAEASAAITEAFAYFLEGNAMLRGSAPMQPQVESSHLTPRAHVARVRV